MRWRLLLSTPLSGPDNMALDEALMGRARRTGEAVLRVYAWSARALSLGRNQHARGQYDDDALARAGVAVLRRPTGGRALLHGREVTYSVTAPISAGGGVNDSYDAINRLLMHGLRAVGVAVMPARPAVRALRPSLAPCFAEPAARELVIDGRKLVASAQWRDGGALLQHGSILLEDDQREIGSLMRAPLPASPRAGTLHDALGRVPSVDELAAALFTAVRECEDADAATLVLDSTLTEDARRLSSRYRDPLWTWRR